MPKVQEKPDAKEFEFKKGLVEFKNVSFGHKMERNGNIPAEARDKDDLVLGSQHQIATSEKINPDVDDIQYLFRDFSMTIEPHTTNAIVGPSGFGKTSMLHLMFRIYDPIDG